MSSHHIWLALPSSGAIALLALLASPAPGLPEEGRGAPVVIAPPDSTGAPAIEGYIASGKLAPEFTLPDASGKDRRLSDFRGRPLILYFYPKDDTPGCTKEACAFRDDSADFDSAGVRVVGISADDPASHRAFIAKYHLPFTLLSDTTGTVLRRYGAGVELDQGGAKRVIAKRITYLIDKDGIVRHVWPRVNPVGHSSEILASWRDLIGGKG